MQIILFHEFINVNNFNPAIQNYIIRKNNKVPSYIVRGGIFVLNKTFQLIFGLICGLLLIKWVPLPFPFSLTELFVTFVLDPVKFFAASLVFIVGIIMHGKLIKYIFTMTAKVRNKKTGTIVQLILCYGVILNFMILLKIGIWQTISLLGFSILYGMISLDYKET